MRLVISWFLHQAQPGCTLLRHCPEPTSGNAVAEDPALCAQHLGCSSRPGGTWYLRQSEGKSFQTTFLTKDPLHGCFGTRAHHTCSVTWLCGMSLALRCQLLRGELGAVLQGCEPDLLVGATFLYPATVFFVVTMRICQYFDDIFPSVPVLAQLPLILLHQNSIPR